MFLLETINNIENQGFFKKAKILNNKIIQSIVSKKIQSFLDLSIFTISNLFLFNLIYSSLKEGSTDETAIVVLVTLLGLFLINIFTKNILKYIIYYFLNFIYGIKNINKYTNIEKLYNFKKINSIREFLNNTNKKELENIEKLFSIIDEEDVNDKNKVIFKLLLNRINCNNINQTISEKYEIIDIANEFLNKEDKYKIFSLIEEIIIREQKNKNMQNPDNVIENIKKLDKDNKFAIKKNKSISIKNI
jgi:hypothetical protein